MQIVIEIYVGDFEGRENKMHRLLLEFEIKTDHLISARRPDLVMIKKKEKEHAKS